MPEPAFGVFNDGYAAAVYEAYRVDPASVDESWRQLFRFAEQVGVPSPADSTAATVSVERVETSRHADTPESTEPAARTESAEPVTSDANAATQQQEFARVVVGISRYLNSIRRYGYLAVQLDPLGSTPPGARELTLEHYGITESDLDRVTDAALGFAHLHTGREVAERLKYRYTRNLAVKFVHCRSEEERQWFREVFTAEEAAA